MAFLVFEGLDGSGKSTLMDRIDSRLQMKKVQVVRTREPGGTQLGDEIRHLILRTVGEPPASKTELLLYQASRAQHVDKIIQPALQNKSWVLCDRFTASSVAFQSGGRSISEAEVHWLNHFSTSALEPDLTILLDLSVEESRRRQQFRQQKTGLHADRMEKEASDFHERVRYSFLQQARANSKSWLVLDATLNVDELEVKTWEEIVRRGWLQ